MLLTTYPHQMNTLFFMCVQQAQHDDDNDVSYHDNVVDPLNVSRYIDINSFDNVHTFAECVNDFLNCTIQK